MEWEGREESENVEDRRGAAGRVAMVGGGGGLIILIIAMLFGVDPQKLFNIVNPGGNQPEVQQPGDQAPPANAKEDPLVEFTRVVFRDTEVIWDRLFREMGKTYEYPTLVLYSGAVDSACGQAESAVGPFYCPGDAKVYIDLSFYRDMQRKLDAPGEFARAYVIAHEVGHHVQKLLGYSRRVDQARSRGGSESNRMSVRLELQADFFAGVWAHHAKERIKLNPADLDSALHAAYEIGDDRLQQKARGYVVPDSFTHGTSEQRARWFREGFRTGNVAEAAQLFDRPYEEL